MWWHEVRSLGDRVAQEATRLSNRISPAAVIEPGAILDDANGPIIVGRGTKISSGAVVRGPVVIGADCLIGNHALVRGPAKLGNGVKIGFSAELKQVLIADGVTIGPMCFVADSCVDGAAYLGAMVRTSNHRLDGQSISVRLDDHTTDTGLEKLGCWIGARASLGIMVIILPGRIVAPDTLFEPRITISRNLPMGHYRLAQTLEATCQELTT